MENGKGIAEKICELQNDITWVKHALANAYAILKMNDTRKPALLLGCYDDELKLLANSLLDDLENLNIDKGPCKQNITSSLSHTDRR